MTVCHGRPGDRLRSISISTPEQSACAAIEGGGFVVSHKQVASYMLYTRGRRGEGIFPTMLCTDVFPHPFKLR